MTPDQPKPVTGQHGSDGMPPLRGPSKPTGEWTVYSVMKLRQKHWHEEDKNNAIAIAHNAAIAAERDENWRHAYDNLLIDYTQLREQLAAEREGRKQDNLEWTKTVSDMSSAHDDDRLEAANQLAAERGMP